MTDSREDALDHRTLKERGAREWLVEGPNSGGVMGVLLWEGKVYWFTHDFGSSSLSEPVPIAEFVARHRDSDRRGVAALVAHALSEGLVS